MYYLYNSLNWSQVIIKCNYFREKESCEKWFVFKIISKLVILYYNTNFVQDRDGLFFI